MSGAMFKVFDKRRLRRARQVMKGEHLHKLKFTEAFHDTLAMMALLIDMTASFTSVSEYRRLPDHCGSLPEFRPLNGKEKKNKRRRS
jgi:hypothetical protein